MIPVRGMKFMYPSGSQPLAGYTIKRGIGVGGFGEVYFAVSDAGKEVALKRIQRNLDIELRGVRQCLNLKHVNLISLWDIRSTDDGQCWVVMEYVPGESLRDVIERHPAGMSESDVRMWFSSAAAGVAYLHDHGIVHRDLKPGNIFWDEHSAVVKIGDYGLSKFISCSRRDGQTESVGTFHYMAPEIGKGVYGKEIDVYALGVILYEMLSGMVPFEGESGQEIIMKHLTARPQTDVLPRPYRRVVERALEKDPRDRYSSVGEMVRDLNEPNPASDGRPPIRVPVAPAGRSGASGLEETSYHPLPPLQVVERPSEPVFIGDDIQFGPLRSSHVEVDAEPIITAKVVETAGAMVGPREPVARAVHSSWHRLREWWRTAPIASPLKVLILVGVAFLLLVNSGWLLPLVLTMAFFYLVYILIRAWTIKPAAAAEVVAKAPRLRRRDLRRLARTQLAEKSGVDKLSELAASLIVAAVASAVLSFLAVTLVGRMTPQSLDHTAFLAWLVVTTVAGAWLVLVAGKLWEAREGEAWHRRFVSIVLGIAVGLVSWGVAQALHIDWQNISQMAIQPVALTPLSETMLTDGNGAPTWPAYALFFGLLFGVLRWWRQADPLRRTRLSLWGVGVCLIAATLLGEMFFIPSPWHAVAGVVIAASIQLSATWLHPQRRRVGV
jgi:hypothetical protein